MAAKDNEIQRLLDELATQLQEYQVGREAATFSRILFRRKVLNGFWRNILQVQIPTISVSFLTEQSYCFLNDDLTKDFNPRERE